MDRPLRIKRRLGSTEKKEKIGKVFIRRVDDSRRLRDRPAGGGVTGERELRAGAGPGGSKSGQKEPVERRERKAARGRQKPHLINDDTTKDLSGGHGAKFRGWERILERGGVCKKRGLRVGEEIGEERRKGGIFRHEEAEWDETDERGEKREVYAPEDGCFSGGGGGARYFGRSEGRGTNRPIPKS